MRTFTQDYTRGIQGEIDIHSVLEEAFDCPLTKTTNPKHSMDFEGDNCWIEIKTRFGISSDSYATMLLPDIKVKFALLATKPVYFVFNLTDGIFYCRFNKELFETYRVEDVCRRDRGETKAVRHYHIPVSDLDWIQKTVVWDFQL
jgi:hypothetical protein